MPDEVAIRICYMGLVLQWGTSPYQLFSIYCSDIDTLLIYFQYWCIIIIDIVMENELPDYLQYDFVLTK